MDVLSHIKLQVLFLLTVSSFFIFSCKECNQSDFGIDHLVVSMCRVTSCVVGKGCLLWPVCSLCKTVSLCPASFCTPRPNLPVILGVSWLPTCASQSPMMKRTSLFFSVLEGLVDLHRTHQLQLLQHQWLRHRLELLCCWMFCLSNELRSSCHFWDCT